MTDQPACRNPEGELAQNDGTEGTSRLNVTRPAPTNVLDAERRRYLRFATKHAEPVYRELLDDLYCTWRRFNNRFYDGQLKPPHITVGRVPPRSFAFCKQLTDWGSQLQMTISEAIALGRHRVVMNPWPALGARRFLQDVLLHESVHQFHYEVTGKTESGSRGHGRHFAEKCNEIGQVISLPLVIPRRRGAKDTDRPVCNHWPHNVRPDDFYKPDVDLHFRPTAKAKPRHHPDWAVVFEAFLGLIDDGRVAELRSLLLRELKRLKSTCAADKDFSLVERDDLAYFGGQRLPSPDNLRMYAVTDSITRQERNNARHRRSPCFTRHPQ